jgi:general L-amino acid transport system permease protein
VAALNTLLLGLVTIVTASSLGLAVGVARTSRNALMRGASAGYVETFRNIPVLLQVFFWYFVVLRWLPPVSASHSLFNAVFLNNRGLFLPTLQLTDGVLRWAVPVAERFGYRGGVVMTPEFMALLIGLSTYNASYIAEIVRSSLQALPRSQLEAAYALGLSRMRALRLVLLPQALKIMLPPLATVYQNVFKGTALGAAIAYPEITSVLVGTVNNIVGQPVIIMSVVLMVYLAFSMAIALLMHWYEAHTRRWG